MTDPAHPCPVCSAPAGEPCDVPRLPLCGPGVHAERLYARAEQSDLYTVDELLAAFAAFSPVPVARAVALVVARLEELAEELAGDPTPAPALRDDGRRARLAGRRTRTLDLYADGMIGPEELRSRLATIDRDLGRLAVEADTAARQTAARAPGARAEALALVGDLAHAWAHLAPAEQRDALAILAAGVALARDEEPAPAWRSVEDLTLR